MSLKFTTLTLATLFAACNPEDENVFKSKGNTQMKPVADMLAQLQDGSSEIEKEVASVVYDLKITTASGIDFCDGEANLKITAKGMLPGIKVPVAKVKCNNLILDFGALLGGGNGLTGETGEDGAPNLTHDGLVMHFKKFLGADFDPPVPFLMGPLVQDSSKFKGYDKTTSHTVTGIDPTTGQTSQGSGQVRMQVLDVDIPYTAFKHDYDKVLHWQRTLTGFEGANPRVGLLVEKMEWFWNTRPMMLPKLVIVGYLKNFIEDEEGTIDILTGKLTVTLIAKSYEIAE